MAEIQWQIDNSIIRNERDADKLVRLKAEEKTAKEWLNSAVDKITDTQKKMKDLTGQIKWKEEAIGVLTTEQGKLSKSNETLRGKIKSEEALLNDPSLTTDERLAIENKIAGFKKDIATAEARLKEIPWEIAPLQAAKESFQEEYQTLDLTLPTLIQQRDDLDKQVKTLAKEIAPIDARLLDRESKVASQQQDYQKELKENEKKVEKDRQAYAQNEFAPQDFNREYGSYA